MYACRILNRRQPWYPIPHLIQGVQGISDSAKHRSPGLQLCNEIIHNRLLDLIGVMKTAPVNRGLLYIYNIKEVILIEQTFDNRMPRQNQDLSPILSREV